MSAVSRTEKLRRAIAEEHPRSGEDPRERWHLDARSGSLRAGIFGMSDGLVSNLALILGVAGSGVGSEIVVLAGVAGLLAGAFSMGVGEYLSMRIQREVFEHALIVERLEIEADPQGEIDELTTIYERKGIPTATARSVAEALMSSPERALDAHAREELGLDPDALGSPIGAALSSFGTFMVGAIVPLIPYLIASGNAAFFGALAAGAAALGVVGGAMAAVTGRSIPFGAVRMLTLGTITASITYGIGSLFDAALPS